AGAPTAASMYAYQGAWVIPFLMAIYALILLPSAVLPDGTAPHRLQRGRLAGLLVAGGTVLVLFAPLRWFFLRHPGLLLLRPAPVAIGGETSRPADSSLGHNLWATAAMFFPFGATGDLDPRRNLPGASVLNLWQAIPFAIGLTVAAWRIRRPPHAIVLLGLVG